MKVRSAYSNLTKTSLIDFRQGKALKMKVHIWSYTANNKTLVFYAVIFTEEINFGEKMTKKNYLEKNKKLSIFSVIPYMINDQNSTLVWRPVMKFKSSILDTYIRSYHCHLLTTWLLCTMYILTRRLVGSTDQAYSSGF